MHPGENEGKIYSCDKTADRMLTIPGSDPILGISGWLGYQQVEGFPQILWITLLGTTGKPV